jgi:8-oxo-dGTP pyrophosphatase MutT (NUDIX family)
MEEVSAKARSPSPPRARRSMRERIATRIAHLSFLAARPMTLGVRGVAIDADGRVLLVKHGYVAGWHFPGGGVEAGETCEAALERELREEANIAVEAPTRLHGLFFNVHVSRRDHVAVYEVRHFRVLGERAPDREILAARFFAPDALPEDTTRATRARLAEILDGREVSALW